MPLRPPCRSRCSEAPRREAGSTPSTSACASPPSDTSSAPSSSRSAADANEDVGQLPVGLEVSRRRESAELAVLHSPRPIGRYEASDSHEVIVTCFGSDDP